MSARLPATPPDEQQPGQAADESRVAIVGGGLAGSLLALALARQGHGVDVYERRPDPRRQDGAAGRSINLGLSKRGMQALAMVGLAPATVGGRTDSGDALASASLMRSMRALVRNRRNP